MRCSGLSLGVYVVTFTDGKRYDAGSLASEDVTDLLTAPLHAHRAHSESVVKSRRVREALKAPRARAAEDRIPLGASALRGSSFDGGRYVLVTDKAKILRRIFEWTARSLGNTAVAEKLNREGVPVISGRAPAWSAGSVGQLATSRTVVGEDGPHRIEVHANGKRTGCQTVIQSRATPGLLPGCRPGGPLPPRPARQAEAPQPTRAERSERFGCGRRFLNHACELERPGRAGATREAGRGRGQR